MANSFTANLNLEKPEVGADSNLWGGHLNSDLDILDSIFTSATTRPQSTIIKSDSKWVDATTTTRGFLFSLAAINTTTTRTLSVQNADGTIAYSADIATATTGMATTGVVTAAVAAATVGMADTSSSQTLTNKTMSGAANTFTNISLTASVTGILPTANGGRGFGTVAPLTNILGGDVAINAAGTYVDGPTVAQGTTGTWYVTGTVTVSGHAGGSIVIAKLWDGTTVIASTETLTISLSNAQCTLSLSGLIASPAGNLRISVTNTTSTTGSIKANLTGNAADSVITAVRVV